MREAEGAGMAAGGFIEPDAALAGAADPLAAYGVEVLSGYRAIEHLPAFAGRNALVDAMLARDPGSRPPHEDQCSPSYYLDVAEAVSARGAAIGRVVEVGVFLGGATEVFAAGSAAFGYGIDLVDVDARYLRLAFERVRRVFPEVAGRVRLFHGALAQYVKGVLLPDGTGGVLVHHDGAHEFGQVVRDLSALSFVREQVEALAIQDTSLRGRIGHANFVDAAVWAVFGPGVRHRGIGAVLDPSNKVMTEPNRFEGNYFLPGEPEGMLIELADVTFRYPHPSMAIDEFL